MSKRKWFTLDELEDRYDDFVLSEDFHVLHGDIDDKSEDFQFGVRGFLGWLRNQE